MRIIDRFMGWSRSIFRRDEVEREMNDEMTTHLERAKERLMARGMSEADARVQARREFGNVGVLQEDARDARGLRLVPELLDDVRYSLRALAHAPAFTIAAALVLGLGIGASTAVFSAVDAVLLARLPYPHDEQLVRVFEQNSPTNRWTLSVVDYQAIERYGRSFSSVGALRGNTVGVSAGRDAERLPMGYVTAGFFDALDVTLRAGRRLSRADEDPGAPAVVVAGYEYAVRQFGSPTAALDQIVTIDGEAHRVVGVLGASDARLAGRAADLWPVMRRTIPTRRGPNGLFVIARIKPGISIAAARRELDAISVRIFPDWQAGFQDKIARLTPYSLRDVIIGNADRPLALFSAAVALVLLIAVSNVASLSVVRCLRRWREIALRSVLGASRGRLVRLIITESIVLATIGGAAGIAVGWVGLELLQKYAVGIARLDTAHLDARALIVALVVSVVAGCAIGIVPAMRLFAGDRGDGLRDGSRAIGDGKSTDRIRSAFVAAEFALALPVLAAGALLLVSVMHLQNVDPGFDPRGVSTMTIGLPSSAYRDNASIAGFWTGLAAEATRLPAVKAAAFGTAMPPNDFGNNNNNFDLVDSPVPPGGAQPSVSWAAVTADFFSTLNIPLLDGRLFTATDTGGARPVVVATKAWAKRYYANRSPIGRELISGGCTACPHTVIVGVVGDVTFDGLGMPREALFSPLTEGWPAQLYLFVKATAPQSIVARGVRDAVRSANPIAAMGPMATMDDAIYNSVAAPRNWATILVAFAAAALVMAAVGIFGLLSYAVALRRREIGVRMALGAPSGRVVASMVGGGMRFAIVGAIIGLGLTVMSSRWLRGSLYGVSAIDPPLLLAVTAGLLVVALIASWLPARRAARIDPVEAMRPE